MNIMKIFSRLRRWLACRHKWKRYDMESWEADWMAGPINVCEPINPNCRKVAVCHKCGEIRSIGKSKEQTLW